MAKLRKNFKVNLGKKPVKQIIQNAVQQAVGRAIEKDPRIIETQTKYQKNGLTFQSNNNSVVPRDRAGNIKLQESATDNPLLIIEAASTKILNNSVLKVIDTQFNYFKFPATTRIIGTDNIDVDLDLDLSGPVNDPIFARYKPIDQQQIPGGYNTPAAELEMSDIEEGASQKRPNRYYITKQIKDSGVDLRFRVKINFRYDSDSNDYNTTLFYITRVNPDEKFIDVTYKEYFNFEDPYAGGGRIYQWEVQDATKEVVIANSEFDVGDSFALFGLAGKGQPGDEFKYSTINADQTYWSITDASKNVDEWNREI